MTTIKCPNCSTKIPIDELLKDQLKDHLKEERKLIRKEVEQENHFQIKEKEQIINDLKSQLDSALKRASQGSMERQGAIFESEIISLLKESFVEDEIAHTGKFKNGADILQTVRTSDGMVCGKILFECKNTKSWGGDAWLTKIKNDNHDAKADICIIVSNTLPKNVEAFSIIDGIWVCHYTTVKQLVVVLRHSIIKINSVQLSQSGKKEKMEKLYDYLISDDFKNTFESILTGFETLQNSHHSEKLKIQKLWKEREAELDRILISAAEFYSNLKLIGGKSIPEMKMLESPALD